MANKNPKVSHQALNQFMETHFSQRFSIHDLWREATVIQDFRKRHIKKCHGYQDIASIIHYMLLGYSKEGAFYTAVPYVCQWEGLYRPKNRYSMYQRVNIPYFSRDDTMTFSILTDRPMCNMPAYKEPLNLNS